MVPLLLLFVLQPSAEGRERISFNDGWRFEKGDPRATEESLAYKTIEPWLLDPTKPDPPKGGAYAEPTFDDSNWKKVRLPHDWGIAGPFDQSFPGETAKLPWWGIGWYRKHFKVPATDAGRKLFIDFDGAMSYSSVWVNGHFVGGRPYGYSSFRVDLTPYVKAGGDNLLAVRLDNPQESSRWYPGGGIYRNVWLVKTGLVAVDHWGVSLTTPLVTTEKATVDLKVKLTGEAAVKTQIFDGKQLVGTSASAAGGEVDQRVEIANPHLWSQSNPHLYRAVTTVTQSGKVVDAVETSFGIRNIEFSAKKGLLINGVRTHIHGVCLHHDLGAIGTAFNIHAAQRQLTIMKSMGVNALRTSHNPPAPEMLDLCDRMGIIVMDEFTDTWTHAKKPLGYAVLFEDWSEMDLRDMIKRDRNHPCVVMWSTGNEIAEQVEPGGLDVSRRLTAIVHDQDPTRPVATGNDRPNAGFNGYAQTIDVFGYNYKPYLYKRFIETNPTQPLFGSETASTLSSRGEYFFPVTAEKNQGEVDYQISSYDLTYPAWASTPDMEFKGEDDNPSVLGEFIWTGFDYLGEPTPFDSNSTILLNYSDPVAKAKAAEELKALGKLQVPSRSSYFGAVDLAGFPKDRFYIYQARWRPELPMAHLLPHWNWPERVGQVTPVHLYTSGDEAELFLNGHSLGRKKRGPREYRLRWDDVVYEPGELKAVVYKNGKPWAQDVLRTTGAASSLKLIVDRSSVSADGDDLAYVTVKVADAKGLMVPRSHNRVGFTIDGPGEIIATDNGDATDHDIFSMPSRRAFNGLCLAIIRTKKGEKGTIHLHASSEGLKGGEITIRAR